MVPVLLLALVVERDLLLRVRRRGGPYAVFVRPRILFPAIFIGLAVAFVAAGTPDGTLARWEQRGAEFVMPITAVLVTVATLSGLQSFAQDALTEDGAKEPEVSATPGQMPQRVRFIWRVLTVRLVWRRARGKGTDWGTHKV